MAVCCEEDDDFDDVWNGIFYAADTNNSIFVLNNKQVGKEMFLPRETEFVLWKSSQTCQPIEIRHCCAAHSSLGAMTMQ